MIAGEVCSSRARANAMRIGIVVLSMLCFQNRATAQPQNPQLHPPCYIRSTQFEGWKAEEMSNEWVQLMIVPQLGGRLMQVTFAGHPYLFVNPK